MRVKQIEKNIMEDIMEEGKPRATVVLSPDSMFNQV